MNNLNPNNKKKALKYRGSMYREADGADGFAEDLGIFTTRHLNPLASQIKALLKRARGLKLKQIASDLEALERLMSRQETDDLRKTQEVPIAASTTSPLSKEK